MKLDCRWSCFHAIIILITKMTQTSPTAKMQFSSNYAAVTKMT